MRRPRPLPEPLATSASFSASDARDLGVPKMRLQRSDLVAPFHGVRSHLVPMTHAERAGVYAPRLRAGQVFSHGTAAALLGVPVPRRILAGALHVSAVYPAQAPRTEGVHGHRLLLRPGLLDGDLPVTGAAETWCQLGSGLAVAALVVAGDHLVRHGVPDPETVLAEMDAAIGAVRRSGARRLAAARVLIRPGVRSPMESLLRVVLVQAGLPEPEINVDLFDASGRFLGEGDLVYRGARQVLEYEGDGHRVDRRQFMKDITRREDFEDAGWGVTRITADDVFRRRSDLIRRIARRIGFDLH